MDGANGTAGRDGDPGSDGQAGKPGTPGTFGQAGLPGTLTGSFVPPLNPPQYQGGTFQFRVNGPATTTFVVQSSTNLFDWVSLVTNVAPFTFTDLTATGSPKYYRVIP
jgi:hypothetical protein